MLGWLSWAASRASLRNISTNSSLCASSGRMRLMTSFFLKPSGPRTSARIPRTMKAVWDDKERPVVGLISDADTNRVFLFCKADKGTDKGLYFELAEQPRPLPYDLSALDAPKADETVRTLFRYARFLVQEGKVKDK